MTVEVLVFRSAHERSLCGDVERRVDELCGEGRLAWLSVIVVVVVVIAIAQYLQKVLPRQQTEVSPHCSCIPVVLVLVLY